MKQPRRHPTTVYLHPRLSRAAKVKAALTDKSLSDVVNEAVARYLGRDEADLRTFEERGGEPEYPLDEVLKDLKRDGLL